MKISLGDRLSTNYTTEPLHFKDFLHICVRICYTVCDFFLMRKIFKAVCQIINVCIEMWHILMKVHAKDGWLHQGLIYDVLRCKVQLWSFVRIFEHFVRKLLDFTSLWMHPLVVKKFSKCMEKLKLHILTMHGLVLFSSFLTRILPLFLFRMIFLVRVGFTIIIFIRFTLCNLSSLFG